MAQCREPDIAMGDWVYHIEFMWWEYHRQDSEGDDIGVQSTL